MALDSVYSRKPVEYFEGIRHDIIARLPSDPTARILEIGCGAGGTGALALDGGRCGAYFGVELSSSAAEAASRRLTGVVCGDVESVELPWAAGFFDVIVLSEVLEHLVDPWRCMDRLAPLLKTGGRAFASSPNVSHFSIIRMLAAGRWDLADRGLMDRTHLRWFTPRTYRELFEGAGFEVVALGPLSPPGPRAALLGRALPAGRRHLLWRQIALEAVRKE